MRRFTSIAVGILRPRSVDTARVRRLELFYEDAIAYVCGTCERT